MIDKKLKNIIEKNPVAFATTNNEGNPHVIFVGDVKIVSDDKILVGDNYMKTTPKNIERNNNVSLAVCDGNQGYRVDGTAQYFREGKWLDMVKKIHKGYPAKGAILVRIKQIRKLC